MFRLFYTALNKAQVRNKGNKLDKIDNSNEIILTSQELG